MHALPVQLGAAVEARVAAVQGQLVKPGADMNRRVAAMQGELVHSPAVAMQADLVELATVVEIRTPSKHRFPRAAPRGSGRPPPTSLAPHINT